MNSVSVDPIADGKRFSLPCRDLEMAKKPGWVVLLSICLVAVILSFLGWRDVVAGIRLMNKGDTSGGIVSLLMAAMSLVGIIPGAIIASVAWTMIRNRSRCDVELRNEKVYSIERFSLFSWRRKFPASSIERFELVPADDELPFDFFRGLFGVFAVSGNDKFLIAPGYQRDLLQTIAESLSSELAVKSAMESNLKTNSTGGSVPAVSDATIPVIDSHQAPAPVLPADSRIVEVETFGSKVIKIPPLGFKKLAAFMSCFGAILLAFSAPISVLILMGKGQGEFWPGFIIVTVFLAIGLGFLLFGINLAKRSHLVSVLNDALVVERSSIFGKKWVELPRSEIRRIRVGPSNVEINDELINELQVITHNGKRHGFLSQLGDQEIEWIAHFLRNELSLDR